MGTPIGLLLALTYASGNNPMWTKTTNEPTEWTEEESQSTQWTKEQPGT